MGAATAGFMVVPRNVPGGKGYTEIMLLTNVAVLSQPSNTTLEYDAANNDVNLSRSCEFKYSINDFAMLSFFWMTLLVFCPSQKADIRIIPRLTKISFAFMVVYIDQ